MKTRSIITSVILLSLIIASFSGPVMAEANDTITLAEGVQAKNAVAFHILKNLGYKVEIKSVGDQNAHRAIAQGDLDIHLGSWMPSMKEARKKLEDEIDLVTTNMDDGLYTMAVPEYVWEAGVKSHADLDKYADKFEKKMYVGPPGWASSKNMNRAVKNNIYGLGDWEAVNSSQAVLMAQMKKAVNNKEWIVFVAWKPHWMNHILDIKYLSDPKGLWNSPESWVDTLARQGLKEDHPEVYQFFKQYKLSADTCNEWIYEIDKKKRYADEVAKEWIAENLDIVQKWVEGVETPEGKKAIDVLQEKFN